MEQKLKIAGQFDIEGTVSGIAPVGNGLINDTYSVTTAETNTPDYILQRINHHIFKDVELLQRNIQRVTDHIRAKLEASDESDIDRKALKLVPAKDGKLYHFDGENYWRMTVMIPRSVTHETMTPTLAEQTGMAFGNFQSQLSDLPEGALGETIPNFHNIEFRVEGFKESIARDSAGRLKDVQKLVEEILERAEVMCKAQQLYRAGRLPKRVTHCDTKVNNLLFDEQGKPLCVIDLDTTMPGFVLSDFGDFIRTGANTGAEDDPDLDNVSVNMDIFRAFSKGYIRSAGSFLTPTERELLPFGAKMLTYMQTVRFLTDYLDGDTYYKIKFPEHMPSSNCCRASKPTNKRCPITSHPCDNICLSPAKPILMVRFLAGIQFQKHRKGRPFGRPFSFRLTFTFLYSLYTPGRKNHPPLPRWMITESLSARSTVRRLSSPRFPGRD